MKDVVYGSDVYYHESDRGHYFVTEVQPNFPGKRNFFCCFQVIPTWFYL